MRATSLERSELLLRGEDELEALFDLLLPAGGEELPLGELLRVLGSLGAEGTESSLARLARHRLQGGEDRLGREQFKALMALPLDEPDRPESVAALFACYGGGPQGLDARRLGEVARGLGEDVAESVLQAMVRLADREGSGHVGLEGFAAAVKPELRPTLLSLKGLSAVL